jgi:hypothetical protein
MCACHVCVLCTQVDVWCSQTQQRIVGYYQANACASDSRWEPPHRLTTPAGLVVWPRTKPLLASVKPVCAYSNTHCFTLFSVALLIIPRRRDPSSVILLRVSWLWIWVFPCPFEGCLLFDIWYVTWCIGLSSYHLCLLIHECSSVCFPPGQSHALRSEDSW